MSETRPDTCDDAHPITNAHRAQFAFDALVGYLAHRDGTGADAARAEVTDDLYAAMSDLLADLRHLCDRDGESFAEADQSAHQFYLTELEDGRVTGLTVHRSTP